MGDRHHRLIKGSASHCGNRRGAVGATPMLTGRERMVAGLPLYPPPSLLEGIFRGMADIPKTPLIFGDDLPPERPSRLRLIWRWLAC